ncbi:MAG: molecular chaperone DnaJ [Coriobacteriaceae bacterium]|nr:molecular chaperone DnaJ [Coriobacteriaceae bacterium]
MNQKDYYAILGVSKDADKKEIQKAFQKKARALHPDINKAPDAEERFKEVSEAYAVLSDEQKRARYDAMRAGSPFAGAAAGAGARPQAGGYPGQAGGFPFGFPFDMAGAGRRRAATAYNPEAGADVVVDVDLTREEARAGARRAVTYRRFDTCGNCHGSGSVASEHTRTCPTCGGAGAINVDLSFLFGAGAAQMQCPECGGTGKVVADPCPECAGSGRRQVVSEAVVSFPADSHDGDQVRVRGMGHAGTNGAATGDLVGRARVASERLEGRARTGFGLIGIALPFLVLSSFSGVLSVFLLICLVPIAVGVAGIAAANPLSRSPLWWRRGLIAMANGAANSLIWALILVWFTSCSQRVLIGPY